MASSSGSATIDHGVLVRQWKWPLRVVWWWFIIGLSVWFGAITVHWYWARDRAPPEERVAYARTVLSNELGHLAALRPGIFDPVPLATWINNTIHDGAVDISLMFARSLMNWPSFMRRNASSDSIRNDTDPGGEFVLRQIREAGDGWHLAVANTGLFAVRTATYLCALPLLGVGVLLGATDGLVARAKRKACAGHESASIYHRAKLGISFVAILGYVVYLGMPQVEQPVRAIFPLALALAVLVRLQCAYYKKYL